MSEANLWRKLRKNMFWEEASRHEDKFNEGIADVSFCSRGEHHWMELKHVGMYPARTTTRVRMKRYTDAQKDFLRCKGEGAGNAWLFVQVEGDHYLFGHREAQMVGEMTKAEMELNAVAHWIGRRLNYEELDDALGGFY